MKTDYYWSIRHKLPAINALVMNLKGIEPIERILGTYKQKIKEKEHDRQLSGEDLIPILHKVQQEYRCIVEDIGKRIAEELNLPSSEVFGVATFYDVFSLLPKGEYVLQVCNGTACHMKGGTEVITQLEKILGIKVGETTDDSKITLETVGCVGACVAPVGGLIEGKPTRLTLKKLGEYDNLDKLYNSIKTGGFFMHREI